MHNALCERQAGDAAASRVPGLVSIPTTHTNAQVVAKHARKVTSEARRLRAILRATERDAHRARIARMRQQVGFSARAIDGTCHRDGFRDAYVAMLTLTYRDGDDWRPEHLTRFMTTVREAMRRAGHVLRYVWVAELQTRGAIHYHVALWLPHGYRLPKPDQNGWWTHGHTRIEEARKAVPYLLKYLSKGSDAGPRLPRGARMHGSGGVEHVMRRTRRWLSYPAWIKARADVHDDWRRALGGGWSDPEGTVIPGEHVRAWLGDRWGALRVADHGRPFLTDGAFTWLSRGADCRATELGR